MNEPHSRTPISKRTLIGTIVTLLLLFSALCVGSGWDTSPTFDEPFFIGAGYSFLKGDEHAQPTANLVLAEKWVALPLLAMKIERPTEQEYRAAEAERRNAYWVSLFKSRSGMSAMLRAARAMNTLLGMALALTVFFWSRRLHGNGAGLISLSFCCFCPVVISNSGLATTDIAATLFFSLAVWSFWKLLHRISVWTVLWCGLALGGLLTTKLSGVLIVPMAALMLMMRLLLGPPLAVVLPRRSPREETAAPRQFFLLISASVAAATAAYLALWAIYGFHYSFGVQTPEGSQLWAFFDGQPEDLVSSYVAWGRKLRLFPEHFLIDVRMFTLTIQHRPAFLMGRYSMTGWWYFFPVAWFFKTPAPFLMAMLTGMIFVLSVCRQRLGGKFRGMAVVSGINFYEFIPLAVLLVVYLAVIMAGSLNIGIRHLLPVYPALFIFVGVLAHIRWWHRLSGFVLAAVLVGWSACEVWAIYPQTLAYFNQFAGGPRNGYRILVDSSSDWGQDLPAVEKWVANRATRPGSKAPVYFSYFGSGALRLFKLDGVVLLPSHYEQPRSFQYSLLPGNYIISATMLQSVYKRVARPWGDSFESEYFGPWDDAYESEYQKLASLITQLKAQDDSEAFAQLARTGVLQHYDDLRLARLCAYLRKREPDDRVSYGVLVYELNQAQLNKALWGPLAELQGRASK